MIFTKVSSGRSPQAAIRVPNLKLGAIVLHELEKDPEDRITSAKEALGLIGKQTKSAIIREGRRRSARPFIYAAGLVLLAVVIVLSLQSDWIQPDRSEILNETVHIDSLDKSVSTPTTLPEDTLNRNTDQAQNTDIPEEQTPAATKPQEKPSKGVVPSPRPGTKDTPLQPHDLDPVIPDSIDLFLTTEPWAHVLINGQRIGTTPLKFSLRLPVGENEFTFRNSAFPVILTKRMLSDSMSRAHFQLTNYVSTVELRVIPWGEVFIDDERHGTTPLADPVFLLPGKHELRVTHPELSSLTEMIEVIAGDTMIIAVDLNKSELAVLPSQESNK